MNKRLFIGIGIRNVQILEQQISKLKLLYNEPAVKWTPFENFHITLRFLGDTDEHAIEEIEQALESASQFCKCFKIKVKDFGTFPNIKMPRVIYAGILPNEELKNLHTYIEQYLRTISYKAEKQSYKPHITAGRTKFVSNTKKLEQIISNLNFESDEIEIDYFSLYESVLTLTGHRYDELQRFYLAEN